MRADRNAHHYKSLWVAEAPPGYVYECPDCESVRKCAHGITFFVFVRGEKRTDSLKKCRVCGCETLRYRRMTFSERVRAAVEHYRENK